MRERGIPLSRGANWVGSLNENNGDLHYWAHIFMAMLSLIWALPRIIRFHLFGMSARGRAVGTRQSPRFPFRVPAKDLSPAGAQTNAFIH